MLFQQIPAFERADLGYAFDQLRRQARFKRIWARLTRHFEHLPCLSLWRTQFKRSIEYQAGIQSVPLEQIRGSMGRCFDFDPDFRPLKPHLRERWIGIALALKREVVLPAVDLVKINDLYFVLDGHHRISVAKFQGKVAIDANVVEWKG